MLQRSAVFLYQNNHLHAKMKTSTPISVCATWPFSRQPVAHCLRLLHDPATAATTTTTAAVVSAIELVEADPTVQSVGAHSFPAHDGVSLQLDAALYRVDHSKQRTTQCGAVMALEGYPGAIAAASLVLEHAAAAEAAPNATTSAHRVYVGRGAALFLASQGVPPPAVGNPIPIAEVEIPEEWGDEEDGGVHAPHPSSAVGRRRNDGHDTVGLIALRGAEMVVGCSTSGKRGKHVGRVGDSPLFGSGLYAQAGVDAATATGDGDRICSFPLSFMAVKYMETLSVSPTKACERAIADLLLLTTPLARGQHNKQNNLLSLDPTWLYFRGFICIDVLQTSSALLESTRMSSVFISVAPVIALQTYYSPLSLTITTRKEPCCTEQKVALGW